MNEKKQELENLLLNFENEVSEWKDKLKINIIDENIFQITKTSRSGYFIHFENIYNTLMVKFDYYETPEDDFNVNFVNKFIPELIELEKFDSVIFLNASGKMKEFIEGSIFHSEDKKIITLLKKMGHECDHEYNNLMIFDQKEYNKKILFSSNVEKKIKNIIKENPLYILGKINDYSRRSLRMKMKNATRNSLFVMEAEGERLAINLDFSKGKNEYFFSIFEDEKNKEILKIYLCKPSEIEEELKIFLSDFKKKKRIKNLLYFNFSHYEKFANEKCGAFFKKNKELVLSYLQEEMEPEEIELISLNYCKDKNFRDSGHYLYFCYKVDELAFLFLEFGNLFIVISSIEGVKKFKEKEMALNFIKEENKKMNEIWIEKKINSIR